MRRTHVHSEKISPWTPAIPLWGGRRVHVVSADYRNRKSSSMQKHAPPAPTSTRPLWVVVLAAGTIVGIAMGLRNIMGLYLPPVSRDLGIGREPFSMAMAVANLIWGLGAVFAGMVADR